MKTFMTAMVLFLSATTAFSYSLHYATIEVQFSDMAECEQAGNDILEQYKTALSLDNVIPFCVELENTDKYYIVMAFHTSCPVVTVSHTGYMPHGLMEYSVTLPYEEEYTYLAYNGQSLQHLVGTITRSRIEERTSESNFETFASCKKLVDSLNGYVIDPSNCCGELNPAILLQTCVKNQGTYNPLYLFVVGPGQ